MRFKRGQSGNPAGRPKGTKDRRTAIRSLLEERQDELVAKAVELALAGDTTALKLCLDRCMAPIRARDPEVIFELQGETLADQGRSVLAGLGTGALTPAEAASILTGLGNLGKLVQLDEMDRRLRQLEDRVQQGTQNIRSGTARKADAPSHAETRAS
jgi:hypothetical protein